MATDDLRVHIDHLIPKQSIRYVAPKDVEIGGRRGYSADPSLRYDDIQRDSWFTQVRKPDFQRETNAWTPQNCLEFIESVFEGRIIPSLILWHSPDSGFIFVLDGAHRLSVLRAWMIDDWGNSEEASRYYERKDTEQIQKAADTVRRLIHREIGSFQQFEDAWNEYNDYAHRGLAPKQNMDEMKFKRATFYTEITGKLRTLSIQWEQGNYDSAEKSFLRINRSGQALDPWEARLIEFRRGSYARTIMSIANAGESGHYWPEPSEEVGQERIKKVQQFGKLAKEIHDRLFVPPFRTPISSLNVPLMIAPAYFQKHKFLFEIIPLIVDRMTAEDEDQQVSIMSRDVNAPPDAIIDNADRILTKLDDALEHLISPTHSSKSLAIAPLFYFYNQRGQHIRALFLGFLHWLLSGSQDDIRIRKLIFSANRDRFEFILFEFKPEIADLARNTGAGLKSTKTLTILFQTLLERLHENPTLSMDNRDALASLVHDVLGQTAPRKSRGKKSRGYSSTDRTQINIRELFESAIRCHICGGIVDLQQGGIQYDHIRDFSETGITDPDTGKPAHAFCNRHKPEIKKYRNDNASFVLPAASVMADEQRPQREQTTQMKLPGDFWGESNFPE